MSDTATFGYGQMQPSDAASEFNALTFLVSQMLARVRTLVLVKVMGVTNTGLLVPAGFVDAQPLVSMVDGAGNATPHGTIYHLPYFRILGGASAIILDPVVGDIGIAGICDRDISSVKTSQSVSPPSTARMHDLADGVYFGGLFGSTPTQAIQFTPAGIVVTGNLIVNGALQLSGNIEALNGSTYTGNIHTTGTVTGDTDVVGAGTSLHTHIHSGVTTGGGSSGPPV